jgi:hypothetical protein
VEALVRGAIPVIDDPELYNLDLRDGVELCVADPQDCRTRRGVARHSARPRSRHAVQCA